MMYNLGKQNGKEQKKIILVEQNDAVQRRGDQGRESKVKLSEVK